MNQANPTEVSKAGQSSSKIPPSRQEYSIRIAKTTKKKFHIMGFNANLGVDFLKWKTENLQVKMERENNMKDFKGTDEDSPNFGAGSEFGKKAKAEARRKKFGLVLKKYKIDDQPWLLKYGGKNGRKFRGVREGGISDNASYYVFTQAGNGVIEAHPLQDWYNFQPIPRYKSLSAEEAEEEFSKRHKVLNYFNLMTRKRLRNDQDVVDDPNDMKGKKSGSLNGKKKTELKISEMDDWIDTEEDTSDSSADEKKGDGEDGDSKLKNKKQNALKKGKKKKRNLDYEAFEESDDGDGESREFDYISSDSSSESVSDHEMKVNNELKGVAEEDALRKLLKSESESEEEEGKEENASDSDVYYICNNSKKEKEEKISQEKGIKKKRASKKKIKPGSSKKTSGASSSSELSPNSTDSDSSGAEMGSDKKKKVKDSNNGASTSGVGTPTLTTGEKLKFSNVKQAVAAAKEVNLESPSTSANTSFSSFSGNEFGVTEDAVRRHLMRKPITTTELLHKFKSKKTGLSSDELVNVMTKILKNINPVKETINNKMYLSLKKQ